jgi:hypothetical protein
MEVAKERRNRRVQMEKGAPYILNKAQKKDNNGGTSFCRDRMVNNEKNPIPRTRKKRKL